MWIPEVSLGNATFQEPVQDVEKVPKTRWKLVSLEWRSIFKGCMLISDSLATSANRRWVPVYSAGTSHVSKHSMLHVLAGQDCVYA
jgi:hypothetical protein